jgi:hypothetical protein
VGFDIALVNALSSLALILLALYLAASAIWKARRSSRVEAAL